MAKKPSGKSSSRKTQTSSSDGPNWVLIGAIVGVGALLLLVIVLLASSNSDGGTSTAALATEDAGFATAAANQRELAATGLLPYCTDNAGRCVTEGNSEAPVTIFEFSDYGCPHCSAFNLDNFAAFQTDYIDTGNVYWITVPYGLTQQGGVVTWLPSAAATLCANEQDAAPAFHHQLFEIQSSSNANTDRAFLDIAAELGLDGDAFESCLDSNRYNADVLANIDLASSIGVRSTPTFVVNGELLPGNDPNGLRQLIESNLNG